jgi:hypothetical protein
MTTQCRDWHAWLNTMPPKPDVLYVVGDVLVNNPGVQPHLTMREPQGSNPTIIILDLTLVQKPGTWPEVKTCASARFDRVIPPKGPNYSAVEIFSLEERIALIENISITTYE